MNTSNPLPPPSFYVPTKPNIPERGRFLTGLLAVRGITSTLAILGALLGLSALSNPRVAADPMAAQLRGALFVALGAGAFDLAAVFGTLSFKKWGVYALVSSTVLSLLLAMHEGSGFLVAVKTVLLLAILHAVTARWHFFE